MVLKGHDIGLMNSYARGAKVGGLPWARELTNPSTVYLSYYHVSSIRITWGNLLITRFQSLLYIIGSVSTASDLVWRQISLCSPGGPGTL